MHKGTLAPPAKPRRFSCGAEIVQLSKRNGMVSIVDMHRYKYKNWRQRGEVIEEKMQVEE